MRSSGFWKYFEVMVGVFIVGFGCESKKGDRFWFEFKLEEIFIDMGSTGRGVNLEMKIKNLVWIC